MSIEYYSSDEQYEDCEYTIEDRLHFIEKAADLTFKANYIKGKISHEPVEAIEAQLTKIGGYPVPSARCWRATLDAVREFRANRLMKQAQDWWHQV